MAEVYRDGVRSQFSFALGGGSQPELTFTLRTGNSWVAGVPPSQAHHIVFLHPQVRPTDEIDTELLTRGDISLVYQVRPGEFSMVPHADQGYASGVTEAARKYGPQTAARVCATTIGHNTTASVAVILPVGVSAEHHAFIAAMRSCGDAPSYVWDAVRVPEREPIKASYPFGPVGPDLPQQGETLTLSRAELMRSVSAARAVRDERIKRRAGDEATEDWERLAGHAAYFRGDAQRPRDLSAPLDLEAVERRARYRGLVRAMSVRSDVVPHRLVADAPYICAYNGDHPLRAPSITFDVQPHGVTDQASTDDVLRVEKLDETVVAWFGVADPHTIGHQANQLVQPHHRITWRVADTDGVAALAVVLGQPHHDQPQTHTRLGIHTPQSPSPDEASRARMVIELVGPDTAALREAITEHPVLSAYARSLSAAETSARVGRGGGAVHTDRQLPFVGWPGRPGMSDSLTYRQSRGRPSM